MRILNLSTAVFLTALGAYAQGTVHFANIGPGFDAPVFDMDGVTKLAGAAFEAQLYVGSSASESLLTAVPGTTVFFAGTASGYFNAGTKTLSGFLPGTRPFFQVRAWEAAGGTSYDAALAAGKKVGKSAVFELADRWGLTDPSGMPPGPPPLLLGLTSFSLVPEPPAIALGIAGAVAVFLFATRRRCA